MCRQGKFQEAAERQVVENGQGAEGRQAAGGGAFQFVAISNWSLYQSFHQTDSIEAYSDYLARLISAGQAGERPAGNWGSQPGGCQASAQWYAPDLLIIREKELGEAAYLALFQKVWEKSHSLLWKERGNSISMKAAGAVLSGEASGNNVSVKAAGAVPSGETRGNDVSVKAAGAVPSGKASGNDVSVKAAGAVPSEIGERPALIPHTYISAARQVGAEAIHLPFGLLQKYHGTGELEGITHIGVSIHSPEEAARAQELGAAYVTAGHIFATGCKPGLAPRGIPFLEEVCASVSIPIYAIGGIHWDNLPLIRQTKASGVCMMSEYMRKL